MTKDEALKLALEALERLDLWLKARYSGIGLVGVELDAITAIKEALAQPERDYERGFIDGMQKQMQSSVDKAVNRMAQRTWVGLTDEDKSLFSSWLDHKTDDEVFTAIEAKLKEKNT